MKQKEYSKILADRLKSKRRSYYIKERNIDIRLKKEEKERKEIEERKKAMPKEEVKRAVKKLLKGRRGLI